MVVPVVRHQGVRSLYLPLRQPFHCCPISCSPCRVAVRGGATAVLGTIQILVGVFNIGLGPGRTWQHPFFLASLGAAYWLGAVFVSAGILSILAGQCPSCCLVGLTVFMNIASAILSIVAIVLYAVDMGKLSLYLFCGVRPYFDNSACQDVAYFAMRLIRGMDVTLVVLAALQLCVSISMSVLAIKALVLGCRKKRDEDVEEFQPGVKAFILDAPSPEDKY
uniref:membrane-spanning 4-domains subfamily A member 3-like n=1 Tax=Doryrhamphus excisus TaxID=161450 RepID=UPI0025AE4AF8|nr:membrane-spanning 4-domains subfamily A member 3-like [Doryrhamphus excisus]